MSNIINFGGGGTGEDILLIPKTITENGRYLPSSDSADGYSEVTVAGADKPIFETVKLYSGKIAHSDGQVVADSDYYYTDYFPIASDVTFDIGMETSSDNYAGLLMYKADKSYVNNWYWNPTKRYRNINNLGDYISQGATWLRLSFPANKLDYAMVHDWDNNIMYSTGEVIKFTDDEVTPTTTKTITSNGTYYAQADGALGYSSVTVNVDNIEPSPAFPSEYQRVEYLNIQAGYFIIDLPVKGIYKCTFSTSESSTTRSQGVFGGRYNKSSNNDRDWYLSIANDLSTVQYWNRLFSYDISLNTITSLSTNTKYTVWGNVIYPTGTNRQAYIGVYNPWDSGTYKTAKYEFYGNFYGVTGYMVNPSSTYTLSPICDYVPCYRKSDDQVGVYDVVNSIFYTPTLLTVGGVQGTVTAGPDVN